MGNSPSPKKENRIDLRDEAEPRGNDDPISDVFEKKGLQRNLWVRKRRDDVASQYPSSFMQKSAGNYLNLG
jgi:hypothetical protein